MKWALLSLAVLCSSSLFSQKTTINADIELTHLQDSVFVHTSYTVVEKWGRIPSNGMLVVNKGKAIMVDTPMDEELTKQLVVYLKDEMNIEVVKFVAGHFHNDCIAGLDYLHEIGVESISSVYTANLCRSKGLPIAQTKFTDYLKVDVEGREIYCEYYGAGHTFDNIVVWVPDCDILFGGCLIKGKGATSLGNTADAMIGQWDVTVEMVRLAFPTHKIVIPGHGLHGGTELFENTIALVREILNK